MTALIQRLFNVRRDAVLPVLLAVLIFFCVLAALMLLRPAREVLGLRGGTEAMRERMVEHIETL
jgi:AAA family ATP:ADP antiporter